MSIPRRFDYVHLSKSEIEKAISFAFPEARIKTFDLIEQGGINSNYRVSLFDKDEELALRIATRGCESISKEHALINSMKDELPVPKAFYLETNNKSISQPFMVTEWLPGQTLEVTLNKNHNEAIETELGKAVGTALAKIGARHFDSFGMLSPELKVVPWNGEPNHTKRNNNSTLFFEMGEFDDVDVSVGFIAHFLSKNAGNNLGIEKAKRVFEMVKKNAALFKASQQAHLVHGDFNTSNILVDQTSDGAWHVSGVLDWEWAHSGSPIFDITNIMRWKDVCRPAFRNSFIQAFVEAGGSLPDQWYERSLLIDLINLLEMIDTQSQLHPYQIKLVKLIDTTLEHFGF